MKKDNKKDDIRLDEMKWDESLEIPDEVINKMRDLWDEFRFNLKILFYQNDDEIWDMKMKLNVMRDKLFEIRKEMKHGKRWDEIKVMKYDMFFFFFRF